MTTTATKALTVFLTGTATWAGVNLPAAWAGAIGVIVATALAFMVPNATIPAPEKPFPTLGKTDAGAVDGGGLVLALVCFLLGVLAVKSGLIH